MTKRLLITNSGSSSIKFSIFELAAGVLRETHRGELSSIGSQPALVLRECDGAVIIEERVGEEGSTHRAAMRRILAAIERITAAQSFAAMGHRVVHGGKEFNAPARLDDEKIAALRALIPLDPLHQPQCLEVISQCAESFPAIPQIAVFDTAFHVSQPAVARRIAIPRRFAEAGIVGYGFHGLSYTYIAGALQKIAPEIARGKIVVAHLGSGSSMCALENCRSVATTMGFSVLDGLVMGTRCGSLDPGVILHLLQQCKLSVAEVESILYKESGLLGVSGLSNDMRVLLESDSPHAAEAVELFVYRAVCEVGALAAALGGIDGLVFTAGIGEHSVAIRERIVSKLGWLGFSIDPCANGRGDTCISSSNSQRPVLVIPTDETRVIADEVASMISR